MRVYASREGAAAVLRQCRSRAGELHANAQPAGSSDEGKRLAKRKKTSDLVFQRNSDLSGAVEPWAPGTLAVVAGCVEIKILRRVHAIDATPARWRGGARSSPCTRLTGRFPTGGRAGPFRRPGSLSPDADEGLPGGLRRLFLGVVSRFP